MSAPKVGARLDALGAAAEIARRHLGPDASAGLELLVTRARSRLGHGEEATVVALAGPTGAGKSTLFNRLCGADVSPVGVRRPTTGAVHACVSGGDAASLLDWLGVRHRHHGADAHRAGEDDVLVLLDLPDFDSTAEAHRREVDRILELVDLIVWVVDPQKYADEALHRGYLRPLARHRASMVVVLNHIDGVPRDERDAVVADLTRRLGEDGLADVPVLPTSAALDEGIGAVRALLAEAAAGRRAAVERITADVRAAAVDLLPTDRATGVSRGARSRLIDGLGRAAGIEAASAIVAAQHRRDGAVTMGWPPLLWWRRRRRQPITTLPRVATGPTSSSEVGATLRDVGEEAGRGMGQRWAATLRAVAMARHDDVASALTRVTADAAREATARPRWWAAVAAIQRVLFGAALAGAGWLIVVSVAGGFLRLATDPLLVDTPGIDWLPLPTLLLLGGVLGGWVVSALARFPVSVAARRRAGQTRARLRRRVAEVAETEVLTHLRAAQSDHDEFAELLALASR